jgi:hypothetical protein
VVLGVYRLTMENVHDILSSLHSRLQALEGNLGVRGSSGRVVLGEQGILKKLIEDLNKTHPRIQHYNRYLQKFEWHGWRVEQRLRYASDGSFPSIVGTGYKIGREYDISIRYNYHEHDPGEHRFLVNISPKRGGADQDFHFDNADDISRQFEREFGELAK